MWVFGTAWSSKDPSPQIQLIRPMVVPGLAVAAPSTVTMYGGVEIGYRIRDGGGGGMGVEIFGEITLNVAVAEFRGPVARTVYEPGEVPAGTVNEAVNPPSVIQTTSSITRSPLNVIVTCGNSAPSVVNDLPVTVTRAPSRPDEGERTRTGGGAAVVGVPTTIMAIACLLYTSDAADE